MDKILSKEDVRIDFYGKDDARSYDHDELYIMGQYAEQQSIAFIKWAVKNHSVEFEGFSLSFFMDGSTKIFVNHEEITIEQFYKLFLEQQVK